MPMLSNYERCQCAGFGRKTPGVLMVDGGASSSRRKNITQILVDGKPFFWRRVKDGLCKTYQPSHY